MVQIMKLASLTSDTSDASDAHPRNFEESPLPSPSQSPSHNISQDLPQHPSESSPLFPASHRNVSSASMSNPDLDSAGGSDTWVSEEKATDIFANVLIR